MAEKKKLVLVFDSQDYKGGPKSMLLAIGRALQVMNSKEWKSEVGGKELSKDLVIRINQDL